MKLLLSLVLTVSALALSLPAQGQDLVTTFKKMDKNRKGPFTANMMQGPRQRLVCCAFPSGFMFQAAYRNEIGRELEQKHGFYVANLFTTNYYELLGKYVFNNQYGNHPVDEAGHRALIANGAAAAPMAASMTRHWVLEKFYVEHVHNSKLKAAFQIRGISGAEFEQVYVIHWMNFYLSAVTGDFQFLPLYMLAKESPIGDSSILQRARDITAREYDELSVSYGESDPMIRRLYQLRNAIHNQLSPDVIKELDVFFARFPSYRGRAFREAQSLIRQYYSVSAQKIADAAKKLGATDVQSMALNILKTGATPQALLQLSEAVANLRSNIHSKAIPDNKRTETLVLILATSQYMNKELTALRNVTAVESFLTVLNVVYMEGFLIKDNWQYFKGEIKASGSAKAAAGIIGDVAAIAQDTLAQAFAPAYDQWLQIDKKMQYFVDSSIKSSSLNTASVMAQRAK